MLGSVIGKAEIDVCFDSERSSLVSSSKFPTIEDTRLLEIPLLCNLAMMDAHISLVWSLFIPKSLLSDETLADQNWFFGLNWSSKACAWNEVATGSQDEHATVWAIFWTLLEQY